MCGDRAVAGLQQAAQVRVGRLRRAPAWPSGRCRWPRPARRRRRGRPRPAASTVAQRGPQLARQTAVSVGPPRAPPQRLAHAEDRRSARRRCAARHLAASASSVSPKNCRRSRVAEQDAGRARRRASIGARHLAREGALLPPRERSGAKTPMPSCRAAPRRPPRSAVNGGQITAVARRSAVLEAGRERLAEGLAPRRASCASSSCRRRTACAGSAHRSSASGMLPRPAGRAPSRNSRRGAAAGGDVGDAVGRGPAALDGRGAVAAADHRERRAVAAQGLATARVPAANGSSSNSAHRAVPEHRLRRARCAPAKRAAVSGRCPAPSQPVRDRVARARPRRASALERVARDDVRSGSSSSTPRSRACRACARASASLSSSHPARRRPARRCAARKV